MDFGCIPGDETSKDIQSYMNSLVRTTENEQLIALAAWIQFLLGQDEILYKWVLDLAIPLHDRLIELDPQVSMPLSLIFYDCYMRDLPGKEKISIATFTLILISSFKKKSHIKYVFDMRKILNRIDFNDSSTEHLKSILLSSFTSPYYISCATGKKFLTFLFLLDRNHEFIADIHMVIKTQIALESNISNLSKLVSLYMTAWSTKEIISGEAKEMIEFSLQDLINHCIHASSVQTFSKLHKILYQFISNYQKFCNSFQKRFRTCG